MESKQAIPVLIVLSLISILFFPIENVNLIGIPLSIAAILGIIYWKMNK